MNRVDRPALRRLGLIRGRRGRDRRRRGAASDPTILGEQGSGRSRSTWHHGRVLRGKLEFDPVRRAAEQAVLEHLLRQATADTAGRGSAASTIWPLVAAVERAGPVTTGERVPAKDVLDALPGCR